MNHIWKTTVTSDYILHLEDPDGWWDARVKRDGCIDLNKYFNAPKGDKEGEADSIHICDLDDFILRLQALRDKAIQHFGPEWPE